MDNQNDKLNELQEMMRLLANSVSNIKGEMLTAIDKSNKKLGDRIDDVSQEVKGLRKETKIGFEKLTKRIDTIGLQVARVEDDTPTREEFDKLENIVMSA